MVLSTPESEYRICVHLLWKGPVRHVYHRSPRVDWGNVHVKYVTTCMHHAKHMNTEAKRRARADTASDAQPQPQVIVSNTEIVVGDVVFLDTGDKLVADGVLIDTQVRAAPSHGCVCVLVSSLCVLVPQWGAPLLLQASACAACWVIDCKHRCSCSAHAFLQSMSHPLHAPVCTTCHVRQQPGPS